MDPYGSKGICIKAMVTKAFITWQLTGKGQGPTIRPAHMSRNGGKLKGEKGTGLPAPGSLATAQGSYDDGTPWCTKHTHQIFQSSRRALAQPSSPGVAWLLHSVPAESHLHISGAVPFSSSVQAPPQSVDTHSKEVTLSKAPTSTITQAGTTYRDKVSKPGGSARTQPLP